MKKKVTPALVSESIGYAATWFSVIELLVVDCAAHLINAHNPRVGEIVCDNLSLSQTLALIAPLAKLRSATFASEVKKASSALRSVSEKRNDLLHSVWIYPLEEGDGMAQLRPRKRQKEITPHTVESLHSHIEVLQGELKHVYMLWDEILNELVSTKAN